MPVDSPPVAAWDRPSAPASAQSPPFPPPSRLPTQAGPHGIRFDFNQGARLSVPEGEWRSCLRDLDTGNVLFTSDRGGVTIQSAKRYYVRFAVEVRDAGGELVLDHRFDARGQEVLIAFPVGTLGDTLGWLPYAERFQQGHFCRLTCAIAERLIPLFRDAYPGIEFVTHGQVEPERYYATYTLGLFFDDAGCAQQPTDFRHVGLHRTAGYILGVDPAEAPARIAFDDPGPPVEGRYVVIAVQASTHAKKWNNPHGWHEVVAWLQGRGLRVVCIDRERAHGAGLAWTHIPHGVEDQTGDRPLAERARWLRHAAAFVGVSSGLAWLAWAAGCPVALVSGFTHPTNEFAAAARVINWHASNSCWNDPRHRFDHNDFLWCPRHAGSERQFECTRLITGEQVIAALARMPALAEPTA